MVILKNKRVGTEGMPPIGLQMADYLLFFKRIPKLVMEQEHHLFTIY